MPIKVEADLYPFVKEHLQAQGYLVRGEVGKCDAVGLQGGTLIAVEMKMSFGLPVLYQAMERMTSVDHVYVAVPVPDGRKARANWDKQVPEAVRLCRMMGFGLLTVRDGLIVVCCDPAPYQFRKQAKMRDRLLSEFTRRSGDYNVGGTTKRPRVTAYREEALRCARALSAYGEMSPAQVRDTTGLPNAYKYLADNPYEWFERIEKGVYGITPAGVDALALYSDVVQAQMAIERPARAVDHAEKPEEFEEPAVEPAPEALPMTLGR
jgi:hypothetical protein